ncbi:dinucleotide-utilizing enzyme [Microbacterium cremeum]|uniref:dinucleotide-utilizing enzyme n=1 Tax=Microbacterium cremeum TaxID=2782169 RepID=UPI0018873B9D|nr:dinucleotide-utilizing enzyme [Microbacterium cremeum]
MSTRPRLVRSIPFWGLLAASLASAGVGLYIVNDKLGTMTSTINDGTATPVDVYVGPSVVLVGAIALGAGIVGVLLTLAVAAASTLRPHPPVEIVEPIDWDADADDAPAGTHGYERGLGYTEAIDTAPAAGEPADKPATGASVTG